MNNTDRTSLGDRMKGPQIQEKLFAEKGINWNDQPSWTKRGAMAVKETFPGDNDSIRSRWIIDREIPIFTTDRNYVQRYVDDSMTDTQ